MKFAQHWVPQMETSECGLACIASVLKIYGSAIDIRQLRERLGSTARGVTARQISQICSALSLRTRAVSCDVNELGQLRCPSILHWSFSHFVVMTEVRARSITILDPASGARSISLAQVGKHFTGIAIEIEKDSMFRPDEPKKSLELRKLFQLTKETKTPLVAAIILTFVAQVLILAAPAYMHFAVNRAAGAGDVSILSVVALAFVGLAVFSCVAGALRSLAIQQLSMIFSWDTSSRFFRKMLALPFTWFTRRRLSDVLARFDALESIRTVFSQVLVASGLDLFFFLVLSALMFFISPTLAAVVVTSFALTGLIQVLSQKKATMLSAESFSASIVERSRRIDAFRAIQAIKLFGAEVDFEAKWKNTLSDAMSKTHTESVFQIWLGSVTSFIESASLIFFIYVGAVAISNGEISIGAVFAMVAYRSQFVSRGGALLSAWTQWRLLEVYSDRISDVIDSEVEQVGPRPLVNGHVKFESLRFSNVGFSYGEAGQPLFDNLSFVIHAKSFTLLRGRSGSGKTTVIRLLCALESPTSGQVHVNSLPMSVFGVSRLRSICGVVMQDDDLLPGTVAENVSFFDPEQDRPRIEKCLLDAQILHEVAQFPFGIETHLGEGGLSVSTGQKQRILIARALYRNPELVVLDEATSNVDVDTERLIIESIVSRGATVVAVSHRASLGVFAANTIDIGKRD